jgi:hypothetical protein
VDDLLLHALEFETLARISVELTLAICIKLFCDNGRVHYRDFVNDFLFWLPGVEAEDGTGLERQVAAAHPVPVVDAPVEAEPVATPLAA